MGGGGADTLSAFIRVSVLSLLSLTGRLLRIIITDLHRAN